MSLEQFRIGAPVPEEHVAFEGPPVYREHADVVAFDQSIAHTGWVHVRCRNAEAVVLEAGSFAIPPEGYPKGHEGTLLRADALGVHVGRMLHNLSPMVVIHETPPVATGRMSRPESSLVAATVIRQQAIRYGHQVVMVGNQHSKKVLVGNGNATKHRWHQALDRLPWTHYDSKPTNEGQRDALCLALTWLLEEA